MIIKIFNLQIIFLTIILLLLCTSGCQPRYPEINLEPSEEEDIVTAPTPHYEPQNDSSFYEDKPYLRITIAPVISSPQSRESYRSLLSYLPEKIEHPVELVMRSSHGEVTQLLKHNMVDIALICPASYMEIKETEEYEVLAVPQIEGQVFYKTHIIASAEDDFNSLKDLHGETFVFTDPLSFSGNLYPIHLLEQAGEEPDTFFADYFYSYNPENSVLAVAEGWIGGGAVNSLVFDYLVENNPELKENLQIIESSSRVGYVPFVVNKNLPKELKEKLQNVLVEMHREEEGRKALAELRMERFLSPGEVDYESFNQLREIWEDLN